MPRVQNDNPGLVRAAVRLSDKELRGIVRDHSPTLSCGSPPGALHGQLASEVLALRKADRRHARTLTLIYKRMERACGDFRMRSQDVPNYIVTTLLDCTRALGGKGKSR